MPRKVDDDCLRELRWFYDRRELSEVRRDIAAWLLKWPAKYPKLCAWVEENIEENIEETLSYYRLPPAHHKHMKSTNMLERLISIKRQAAQPYCPDLSECGKLPAAHPGARRRDP